MQYNNLNKDNKMEEQVKKDIRSIRDTLYFFRVVSIVGLVLGLRSLLIKLFLTNVGLGVFASIFLLIIGVCVIVDKVNKDKQNLK